MAAPSIESLPFEMRAKILLYLPVDRSLSAISLLAHGLFDEILLNDYHFARSHVAYCCTDAMNDEASWIGLIRKWAHLPVTYRAVFLTWEKFWMPYESSGWLGPSYYWVGRKHHPSAACVLAAFKVAIANDTAAATIFDNFPVIWAARRGDVDLVDFLLQTRPIFSDFNQVLKASIIGDTIGCPESVSALLKYSIADKNTEQIQQTINNELIKCARYGRSNMFDVLISDPRASISIVGNNALMLAIRNGYDRIVTKLLQHPQLTLSNEIEYFSIASERGYTSIVETMLNDCRFSVTACVDSQLLKSILVNGHVKVIKLLLNDPRLEISAATATNLFDHAVVRGKVEILQLLLTDRRGFTFSNSYATVRSAIRNCVSFRQDFVDTFALLLEDPSSRFDPSAWNNSAVVWAVEFERIDLLKMFLANGRVNAGDQENLALMKALELTSKSNRAEILELLLQHKTVDISRHDVKKRVMELVGKVQDQGVVDLVNSYSLMNF
ncbi:hypothetical protein HK100_011779 [Physocladia obscura]|uniref:Uncharacterized protein n=1 Tax=Physocladia obscura TaxID=109957 RepID=A0AAD5TB21_9FUNG|nr:hypothetical protein HK100_011779 [Physocladia obscura]